MPPLDELQLTDITPPARITITGEFWDSQIYSRVLSLFTCDRRLLRLDWKALVSQLPIQPKLSVAANIAFLGNRKLYGEGAQLLLSDPRIRDLLIDNFHTLGSEVLVWDESELEWSSECDNTLPFPHNDSEIHYQNLYVGSAQGIHSVNHETWSQSLGAPERHSDVVAIDLAAKYRTIVFAAGQDGLYQIDERGQNRHERRLDHVSDLPCLRCEWTYSSIVASGLQNHMYVAEYNRRLMPGADNRRTHSRIFERVITGEELFGAGPNQAQGITWGARNRLFRFSGNQIEVTDCKYRDSNTMRNRKGLHFESKGTIPATPELTVDDVISARVAPFGSVIELHDSLLVIPTRGRPLVFPGEPTNWRVFPRSSDYLNHLHIAYEDHLEIIAFTHDYFVADQASKQAGFSVGSSSQDD